METTEKIVEAYVRYVKGWATIPNIRCDGQFEIDLIAIDPNTSARYHIETSVSGSTGFSKLTAKEFDREKLKQRVEKAKQRRTVGFFAERKFGVPEVRRKLADYGFVPGEYRNVVVTWDWTVEAKAEAQIAGIELWSFQAIMTEIAESIRHHRSYFTDDTLRTINLFVRALADADRDQAPKIKSAKPFAAAENPTASAPFWVYRNWVHRRARLHKAACGYCNDGKGAQGSTGNATGAWSPFKAVAEGTTFLNSLQYEDAAHCGVCM